MIGRLNTLLQDPLDRSARQVDYSPGDKAAEANVPAGGVVPAVADHVAVGRGSAAAVVRVAGTVVVDLDGQHWCCLEPPSWSARSRVPERD